MMNYFENVKTIEELKKAYFKAAKENHPDHGGNVEIMKILNNQYAELQKKLKNVHTSHNGDGETYTATTETSEVPEDFINIVNELLKMQGLTIELCGRWLWIGGNTKENKDGLKALGCRWSKSKQLWSWHYPEDGVKHYKKKDAPMEEIRSRYGSETFVRAHSLPVA